MSTADPHKTAMQRWSLYHPGALALADGLLSKNYVELWFSKVQRHVLSPGLFTSTADLARKLRRYITAYAKQAKPFRWKYDNPARGIGRQT